MYAAPVVAATHSSSQHLPATNDAPAVLLDTDHPVTAAPNPLDTAPSTLFDEQTRASSDQTAPTSVLFDHAADTDLQCSHGPAAELDSLMERAGALKTLFAGLNELSTLTAQELENSELQRAFDSLHDAAHNVPTSTVSDMESVPRPRTRARAVSKTLLLSTLFVVCSVLAVSVASYMVRYREESVAARLATWARDHNLGPVVDRLEQWRYSSAPAKAPATELPSTPAAPQLTAATPAYAPEPLTPVVTPVIKGEGVWVVEATARNKPAIWVTSNRPLVEYPSVTATYALIDQTHLVAGMWNGPEVPGRHGFSRFGSVSPRFWPWLTAAFNGGFRREHSNGGYYTEGRELWPMVPGIATLAIDSAGKIHIGAYGEEITAKGMVSMRQNVHLLVQRGRSAVGEKDYEYGAWKDGNLFIMRSGLCERTDGKLLYVVMGPANARQFAHAMLDASCRTGMQLDVNAAWPKFSVFSAPPVVLPGQTPSVDGHKIDSRITGDANMFVKGAPKDFFALFSDEMPTTLQAGLR